MDSKPVNTVRKSRYEKYAPLLESDSRIKEYYKYYYTKIKENSRYYKKTESFYHATAMADTFRMMEGNFLGMVYITWGIWSSKVAVGLVWFKNNKIVKYRFSKEILRRTHGSFFRRSDLSYSHLKFPIKDWFSKKLNVYADLTAFEWSHDLRMNNHSYITYGELSAFTSKHPDSYFDYVYDTRILNKKHE